MTVEALREALAQEGAECEASWLLRALQRGTYRPAPVFTRLRRKPDGGFRTLGVPRPTDMAVQRLACRLGTSQLDRSLLDGCHGFRPGRSVQTALAQVDGRPAGAVIGCDIQALFDSLGAAHVRPLMDAHPDRWWRSILEGQLACWSPPVPQGAPLSPLLSNLVLHTVLDRPLQASGLRWVRYADDLLVLIPCRTRLPRTLDWLTGLARHANLAFRPDKTRITHAGLAQGQGLRVLGRQVVLDRGVVRVR